MAKRRISTEEQVVFGILRFIGMILIAPFKLLASSGGSSKKPSRNAVSIDKDQFEKRWREIDELQHLSGASHWKMAVMQGDSLFNDALKGLGVPGETFADRLKSAQDLMPWEMYQSVWQAHKLRNRLAHEVDAEIMSWEAKEALHFFRVGLEHLKILG